MKLILLTYLEGDEPCVDRLLHDQEVPIFSRMPIEGHGWGTTLGWYHEPPPYRSRMTFTIVPDELAERLLSALEACRGVQDSRHPIHALQLDIERMAHCARERSGEPSD